MHKVSFESENLTEPVRNALRKHGIDAQEINHLRYSVNQNFQVKFNNVRYFLRVYRPNKETLEGIRAEHEYLSYLRAHDFNTPAPILMPDGKSIGRLKLPSGSDCFFSLFEFIEGFHLNLSEVARSSGKCLGQLHSLSRQYENYAMTYVRRAWDQASWVANSEDLLKQAVPTSLIEFFLRERDQILDYLARLPRGIDEFGLVHYDFHQGNVLSSDKGLYVVDFDDCCRHFFVWDFAMPMHRLGGGFMSDQGLEQKNQFIQGYRESCELSGFQELQIRKFERLRHLFMVCWLAERATEDKWREIVPKYIHTHGEYLRLHPDFI